jgi:L-alanine-DL-glutamate epimerase-like enolase superfamily enzyme
MKITRVETIPIKVPVVPRFAIRSGRGGSHTVSPFLLVKIHTDEGLVGLGEASCTPRWSGEDQFSAAHFINNYLAPQLVGENPLELKQLTAKFRVVAGNYFTKSALEMALWDIAGKSAGKPVYQLLGSAVREFVPTKWSVSGVEPAAAADIGAWAIEQGFRAMKVKVGLKPEEDIARVSAVRNVIGDKTKLGVDANGGWSPEVAVKTIEQLYASNIYFAEQPVSAEDVARMSEVRRQIKVPVIADESVYTLQDAVTLSRLEAADVLSVYIGKAGGIGPARKIAEFAQQNGLKCTIGSNLELGVGSAAMIHLGIATAGITAEQFPCDIIGPFFYETDLLKEPLPISPGSARPNDKPGLGVELDDDQVKRFRV